MPRRLVDGLALGARDPHRRMRLLHRLRHQVAAGHGEVLALEAGIGVHHQHVGGLLGRLPPHRAGARRDRCRSRPSRRADARLAGAPFDATVRDEIERGDALGHARGMVVARRHQHDAVAEPDALGALRAGGEEHLRRGGVRVLLEEVVLDLPGVVDAELVGELHLVERLLEQPELGALDPRPRQLMLVEDAELHGCLPGRALQTPPVWFCFTCASISHRAMLGEIFLHMRGAP